VRGEDRGRDWGDLWGMWHSLDSLPGGEGGELYRTVGD
jgi:hypothetical protein